MGIEKLEYLVEVERHKRISKAAEALYMSQPSLSKSIAAMEKQLGCKLFERTASGLEPTPEGKRFLAYAHEVLSMRQMVLSDLQRISEYRKNRQTLHLGISHMRSCATLSRSLMSLFSAEMNISLIGEVKTDPELEADVLSGALDCAVITLPMDGTVDPALHVHHLVSERLLLAVPRIFPVLKSTLPSPGDFPYLPPAALDGQQFILPPEGNRVREMIDVFFRAENIHPECFLFESAIDFALTGAEKGLGICFLNERLANAGPRPDLCYCKTAASLPVRNVGAIWKKSDSDHPEKMALYRLLCDEWLDLNWSLQDDSSSNFRKE